MINVSNEFLKLMEKKRNFMGYADITFADGSKLTLTEDDFTVENNSVTDSAGANGIPLGVAVCKTVQLEIANPNDKYSDYDFFGSKFVFKIRYKLSETIESFNVGEFTVLDPYTYGETIILTAMDNMYRANDYYSTKMTFPATTRQILSDICSTYDIPLGTTSFPNDDFVIDSRPEGNYLVRNLIGYIAMLSGGNARINRNGELEIVTYDFSILDMFISGGSFKPWTEGEQISGGTLNPWTEGDELSGGEFTEKIPYHVFRKFKNLKVDTDDVVITGVQIAIRNEDGTTTSLLKGEKGYVLEVENPLVTGKEAEAIELVGNALIGGHMRRFEGDHLAYPLAEFMDPCVIVDRKGNPYPTFLTDIDFNFFGFTTIKNTAESPGRKSVKYTPGYVKAIYEAQKLVEKERTDRELAVEQLNKTLDSSSGMYSTDIKQEDGSTVRYLHDKKTLGESQNVIKVTAEAIGFSKDGGKTYPYGMTLDGKTITNLLYAEGINADFITSGSISDVNKNNVWDLLTGKLVMNKGTITLGSKKVFHASDYTESDKTLIRQIIDGQVAITDEYLKKYDFDGKGDIRATDYMKVSKLVAGTVDSYTLDMSVKISGGEDTGNLIDAGDVTVYPKGIRAKYGAFDYLNVKNPLVVHEYTDVLTKNSYVSPYTYYGYFDIPTGTGEPISIYATGSAGEPVPCCIVNNRTQYRVCANSEDVTVRIICLQNI